MNKQKMNKKGQTHISETIAVLFIFFILVLFGVVFYYKYQQSAIREEQEELLATRAMESTLKALYLPELICSKGEAEREDDCFDMLKLRSANNTFNEYMDSYYFDIFSYSKIYVKEVYPQQKEWVLYDKPKPDFTRKEPTYFVTALRDDTAGEIEPKYSFGYLVVEVYS
ncbi:MAG: hypothetical protein AB1668_02435 [Nanoarchaeota archaeon]